MTALLQGTTRLVDLLLDPVAGQPVLALGLVAVLFSVLAVLLFKLATPQRRLSAARSRLIGRLYEAAIYQTSLKVILMVQGRLILANMRYLSLALPGLAALLIPLLLALPQLDVRFGRRPLLVGETVLVTAAMADHDATSEAPSLIASVGLRVEAGPVQHSDTGALTWRVRALAPGRHDLRLDIDGQPIDMTVPVAVEGLPALTRSRHADAWSQALHDPAGRPLRRDKGLSLLTVELPARALFILGQRVHWLVAFTVAALAAGLLLRRPLRVEF